jgi:uncharacterized protein DUF6636
MGTRPRSLLIGLLAVALLAVTATPALARTKSFHTPSRNIYCLYMSSQGPGPWIRCDVRSLNDTAFRLDRTHKGRKIHITDSVFNRGAKVLRYGRSLSVGPFTCTSRRSGLTCRSRASGHGFKISRQKQKRF